MAKDERKHYDGIMEGARYEGALLTRIPDAAYTGKKPFDMFGLLPDGRALAVEVKESESVPRDPISLLERHQVAWLTAYASRNGVGLVVVYCSRDKWMRAWKMTSKGTLVSVPDLRKAGARMWLGIVQAAA